MELWSESSDSLILTARITNLMDSRSEPCSTKEWALRVSALADRAYVGRGPRKAKTGKGDRLEPHLLAPHHHSSHSRRAQVQCRLALDILPAVGEGEGLAVLICRWQAFGGLGSIPSILQVPMRGTTGRRSPNYRVCSLSLVHLLHVWDCQDAVACDVLQLLCRLGSRELLRHSPDLRLWVVLPAVRIRHEEAPQMG